MKRILSAAVLVTALVVPSFGQMAKKDIVDTAVGAGRFKTLVTAVKAAGLVSTLKSAGPFTVFAPTDTAFSKVPKATLAMILKDKALLKKILLYHVVPGKIMAKDARTMMAPTASGEKASVKVMNGKVMVGKATVVIADVQASNGVIHAIDTVLIPPSVMKMMKKPMKARRSVSN